MKLHSLKAKSAEALTRFWLEEGLKPGTITKSDDRIIRRWAGLGVCQQD